MQNKLQEITEKLYNEGLSKGRQEAEELLKKAKADSERMVTDARKEAGKIIADAEREAAELKTKAENDIKMASVQSFASIRQEIENAIIAKAVSGPVTSAVNETEFIKGIITEVVSAFDPASSEPVSLELLLPEKQKESLDNFIKEKMAALFKEGLEIKFTKNLNNGFRVGYKEGGYFISFTDQDFNNIISEYLRPKTRKLLFGE